MSENGNGTVVRNVLAILAGAGALAAIIAPMQGAIDALGESLQRIERQASEAREMMKTDQREYVAHVEERLQAAINSHSAWALDRNTSLEADLSELRERIRGAEAALVENETQHKWIADEINGGKTDLDVRTRAYWDGTRIVWPQTMDEVLESVGEAVHKQGNGHK